MLFGSRASGCFVAGQPTFSSSSLPSFISGVAGRGKWAVGSNWRGTSPRCRWKHEMKASQTNVASLEINCKAPTRHFKTRQDVFCAFENLAVLQQIARGGVRRSQT